MQGLHLTFTRSGNTVELQQLGNCAVVVERPGEISATLTRNKSCTIRGNSSVFYYCREKDDGRLYIDREAVILVQYANVAARETLSLSRLQAVEAQSLSKLQAENSRLEAQVYGLEGDKRRLEARVLALEEAREALTLRMRRLVNEDWSLPV